MSTQRILDNLDLTIVAISEKIQKADIVRGEYAPAISALAELVNARANLGAAALEKSGAELPKNWQTNQWRRFEPLTDDPEELQKFEELMDEKQLSRQDLARILFSLRVRPGFQRADFGI